MATTISNCNITKKPNKIEPSYTNTTETSVLYTATDDVNVSLIPYKWRLDQKVSSSGVQVIDRYFYINNVKFATIRDNVYSSDRAGQESGSSAFEFRPDIILTKNEIDKVDSVSDRIISAASLIGPNQYSTYRINMTLKKGDAISMTFSYIAGTTMSTVTDTLLLIENAF